MKKFSKKLLCLVLVLMMAMPIIVLPANAETTAEPLYKLNFNGDAVLVNPKNQWAGVKSSTISDDGSSVTIEGKTTTSGSKKNQSSAWGNTLVGFDIVGNSYTVVLTVDTGEDDNEEVGFLFCDYAGFIVNPGQNSYNFVSTSGAAHADDVYLETDENGAKKNATYDGNGETKQSYAIQWKVSGTVASPVVESYNLYAAKDGNWISVCLFTADDLTEVVFDWAGEAENDFEFRILHNCYLDNQGSAVTVSDVTVYDGLSLEGITAPEDPEEEPPVVEEPIDSTLYDAGNVGDVLYTANFNGDERWAPSSETAEANAGWQWTNSKNMSATVDAQDSGKATIKLTVTGNAGWGGDVKGLPLGDGYDYTVKFTMVRPSDNTLGLLIDGHNGAYLYASKGRLQYNGSALTGHDYKNYSGNLSGQEYAIVINGDDFTFACYVKDADGEWILLDEGSAKNGAFERDYLGLYFYSYSKTEVTVSDVKVYKGVSVIENENIMPRLKDGAAVRMDDPTGLRFTGFVGKDYFDGLETQYGAEKVEIGMLITPTDYLTANNLEFTKNALDTCEAITGVKYLEIDATTILTDGNYYKVNCVIANIKEANYDRAFSAILYIKVNGEIIEYSEYDAENNSRSVAYVAELAYGDLADAEGTVKNGLTYSNPVVVGDVTKYSPYTEDQRKILEGFFQQREQENLVP